MKRFLIGLVAVGIGVLAGAGGASASGGVEYPPSAPVLLLSDSTVAVGEQFDATLQGCAPGESVELSVDGSSTTASGSSATGTLTAPTTAGSYEVTGVCQDSGLSASATLTVVAADGDDDEFELPATGSSTTPMLQAGGILLVAGLGMLGAARLRRRATV